MLENLNLNLIIVFLRVPGGLGVEDTHQPPSSLPDSEAGVGHSLRQMMEATTVFSENAVRWPTEKNRKVLVSISTLNTYQ